ncbi:hypothetical protein UY3_09156 [Chelonia mydas]|uniref:Uncharacterized protein n=1 Tax=Chelonia mydas TaxID=8469 RepID=M7BZZ2_CHEMY|nr:hypothetical protein UY3_09156 [Chelonia mydas]
MSAQLVARDVTALLGSGTHSCCALPSIPGALQRRHSGPAQSAYGNPPSWRCNVLAAGTLVTPACSDVSPTVESLAPSLRVATGTIYCTPCLHSAATPSTAHSGLLASAGSLLARERPLSMAVSCLASPRSQGDPGKYKKGRDATAVLTPLLICDWT